MNIQLYTFPDNWKPPGWAHLNYDVTVDESEPQEVKELDPNRFEKLIPKNYYLFNGGRLQRCIIPLASMVFSIATVSVCSLYFSSSNFKIKAMPILYFGLGCTYLVDRFANFFFSPKPTEENLNEAILEAYRNPIMKKLFDYTSKDHKIEVRLVDRLAFKESTNSMAHCFIRKDLETGRKISVIEIWDGKRPLKSFLFDKKETTSSYNSDTNPIIWNSNPLTLVIFEMINTFQREKFIKVLAQASRGELNRKEYVILKEFIEAVSVILFCQVINYGIEHMGWDKNWFHMTGESNLPNNLEEEINFFKNFVWPADIEETPGKKSHAREYSDQWFELGFTQLLNTYTFLMTGELVEKLKKEPVEPYREHIAQRFPEVDTSQFKEALDCIVYVFFSKTYEVIEDFFEVDAVQNECRLVGINDKKLDYQSFYLFMEHLIKKRRVFDCFISYLKQNTSKITQEDFVHFSKNFEGRCLLRVLEDSLFDQDIGQKIDLDYLKSFLSQAEVENMKLHARWLLEDNYPTSNLA